MITNQEYEKAYLLVRKIVHFVGSLGDEAKYNTAFYNHLQSIGFEFDDNLSFQKIIRVIIFGDILNCYFLLGYKQKYNRDLFLLFDMVEYSFYLGKLPWDLRTYRSLSNIQATRDFFSKGFELSKKDLGCFSFPLLYIELSKVKNHNAEKYVNILQEVVNILSKNQNINNKQKDERIDILLSNPHLFLEESNENNKIEVKNDTLITDNINEEQNIYNMELLKDKLFNGVSFEILKEEYVGGTFFSFELSIRISNYNNHKKKIKLDIRYISIKHGLKSRGGIFGEFIPDNSFVDVNVDFEDITCACNGDRIELEINEGKFASLRLVREKGQWTIVESIERSTYNRELKSKIEHFEAIEEQFGIILQNFSVKVEDENTIKMFCEVFALNGELPKEDFTINVAIYDNNNDIVFTDSETKYAEDFKGFEVLTFAYIKLDITVDEISKIRIYPTR